MATKMTKVITRDGVSILKPIISDIIKPEKVEGLEESMHQVDTLTSKFNILQQQIDRNKKSDHRRNWTNPRRYSSAGNSKRKA